MPLRLPHPSPRFAAGSAACVCLALVALFWRPSAHEPSRLTIPSAVGVAGRLSVSPDGRRVAYSSSGRLWVRTLGDPESRPLDATTGAGAPFWSPDGKYLAFPAGGKLRKIAAAGGLPQSLCNVNTNMAGAWNSNGDILIGQIGDGIYRVPESGGEPLRITQPDPMKNETRHMLPQFLPGGKKFLYVAGSDKPGYSVLWAATLSGGERKALMSVESGVTLVTPERGSDGYLIFLRDHDLMAQSFDVYTLELIGSPRMLAASVASVQSMGSVAVVGDFAAAGRTLAYRAGGLSLGMRLISTQAPAIPLPPAQEITVLRNWR